MAGFSVTWLRKLVCTKSRIQLHSPFPLPIEHGCTTTFTSSDSSPSDPLNVQTWVKILFKIFQIFEVFAIAYLESQMSSINSFATILLVQLSQASSIMPFIPGKPVQTFTAFRAGLPGFLVTKSWWNREERGPVLDIKYCSTADSLTHTYTGSLHVFCLKIIAHDDLQLSGILASIVSAFFFRVSQHWSRTSFWFCFWLTHLIHPILWNADCL
jgi:hypothetical protein